MIEQVKSDVSCFFVKKAVAISIFYVYIAN